jgi:hypothetical protein
LAIHRLLVDKLEGRKFTSLEAISQFAVYFEYLTTLPAERQKVILGNKEIPFFGDLEIPKTTVSQHEVSRILRKQLKEIEGLSELVVEDEFRGLKTGVFPMDLAVKDKKSGKILLFVELDGEEFHYIKGVEGKLTLKRINELKAKLYEYHYPGVPLKRIRMDGTRSNQERAKEIFLQIVDLSAGILSVDRKVGFVESLRGGFRSILKLFRIPFFRTVKE